MGRPRVILIALVAGFLCGLALNRFGGPSTSIAIAVLAPIGTLFVNLIRMTAVPLAATMIVASLGSMPSSDGLTRVSSRVVITALALLLAAAVASLVVAAPLVAAIPIDRDAVLAMRPAGAAGQVGNAVPASGLESLTNWVLELVPTNVIKSAADGAMLPIIVFAVFFGLALNRVPAERRLAVVRTAEGIADAMQQIIAWVLVVAPIGVFALAVPLAARLGVAAAGAVVAYVGLVVGLTIAAVVLLLYPAGVIIGRRRLSAFITYCGPGQAVAFAGRSSLAALPVVVDSAEQLGLTQTTVRVILPIATTIFHFGTAIAHTVGTLFVARLFGVALTVPQLASVALTTVVASFAVPGVPGGSVIAMVPVLAAANLPLDGIAILLAVDAVPDMFRTAANVTGALTLAVVTDARDPGDSGDARSTE